MSQSARILVIDDDEFTREVLRELLAPKYAVSLAVNGLDGIEQALADPPDLILCDIRMPLMDGFGVVSALRDNPATAAVPFIFLSAGTEPEIQRKGMNLGADDFMIKPVRRTEVLETLEARLRRARSGQSAPAPAAGPTASWPSQGSPDETLRLKLPAQVAAAGGDEAKVPASSDSRQGTVLRVAIHRFDELAGQLTSEEFGDVLTQWHRSVAEETGLQKGWLFEPSGDSALCLFDTPPGRSDDSTQRALKAAAGLIHAAGAFRHRLKAVFGERLSGDFSIAVTVHRGPVALARARQGAGGILTVIGETVDRVRGVRRLVEDLGWSLAVGVATASEDGGLLQLGRTQQVQPAPLPDEHALAEVLAMTPEPHAPVDEQRRLSDFRQGVIDNDAALAMRPSHENAAGARGAAIDVAAPSLDARGYRVVRSLGGGGMSRVYLARENASGGLHVLKVMMQGGESLGSVIRQFLHEYELISRITHPQVVRIYDQWFADGLACIAMEYFPGGDLRRLLRRSANRALDAALVVNYIRQIATGLGAIHAAGIVHRDLKPDNVMLRVDGTLAISDFGIAQRLATTHGANAGSDEITGTSYYVSPEQVMGEPPTPAADLYSLGIMFYEMLTGRRPYVGDTIESILKQHAVAEIPLLPENLSAYQPVLNRMLAKRPAERFARAASVISALEL